MNALKKWGALDRDKVTKCSVSKSSSFSKIHPI